MTREILFKARMVKYGEWIEGDVGHCKDGRVYIFPSSNNRQAGILVKPETICEFTGLLDSNKERIFEGDEVTTPRLKNRKPTFVDYQNGGFVTMGNNQSCESLFHFSSYTLTGRNVHDGGQDGY